MQISNLIITNITNKINKNLIYLFYSILLISLHFMIPDHAFSQKSREEISEANRDKALYFFIEGKTLELKNDFIGAVENLRTALKYDKSPGIYYAISEVYFKLNKFDEALTEIKKALNLDSRNQNYLEILANIYIAKKEFPNAINTYERIIAIDSNYTYGLYSLARLYQEMKLPAKAILVYEKITNRIGFDFDVLNKMYEIYSGYKDYEKAIGVLEDLLKLDPYNIEIKKVLSSLYLKNNQPGKTREIYEEILLLNPADKDVQTELVKIYFKENDSRKAFENFRKMIGKDSLGYYEKVQIGELYYNMISQDETSIDIAKNIFSNLNSEYPEQWIPYYYLGAIDILNKNGNSYKEQFSKALQYADTSRDVYTNIGFTLFQKGESEDALKIFDEGLVKFPDDFRLNYFKGFTLQGINKESEAITYFEKAVNINPNDIGLLSTLALAYDNQAEFKKSEATYNAALKIDPNNALILNNYAYNLSERGENLDKALAMSKISIAKDPANSSYFDTIGWIYFKMKNYDYAKKYIERSLEINGNSAVVLDHLADVYSAMKDYTNAKKYWNLSLSKNPNNENVRKKLEFIKN